MGKQNTCKTLIGVHSTMHLISLVPRLLGEGTGITCVRMCLISPDSGGSWILTVYCPYNNIYDL